MSSGQPASPSSNSGFSLVELLVVMVILGIITMGAIPFYSSMRDKTKSAGAMVEIRGIEKAIIAFSIDNGGRFPDDLAEAGKGDVKDPWGRPYQYWNVAKHPAGARMGLYEPLNTDFDLWSDGADGVIGVPGVHIDDPASADDVLRSADGTFVGVGRELK